MEAPPSMGSTSVANGEASRFQIVAAVVADPKTDPGTVVILGPAGELKGTAEVGPLPDSVTFTPDGEGFVVQEWEETQKSMSSLFKAFAIAFFLVFMILAGVNFSLHYQMMRGRPLAFWRDSECRFFLGAVLVLVLLVSFDVFGAVYRSAGQALRYGAFQVVSIVTTTGFATADYEKLPAMSQLILLLCMFLGASAALVATSALGVLGGAGAEVVGLEREGIVEGRGKERAGHRPEAGREQHGHGGGEARQQSLRRRCNAKQRCHGDGRG